MIQWAHAIFLDLNIFTSNSGSSWLYKISKLNVEPSQHWLVCVTIHVEYEEAFMKFSISDDWYHQHLGWFISTFDLHDFTIG